MYKSDKTAFEHSFLLFMLGVVALNAIDKDKDKFADPVKKQFLKLCDGKDENKIIRRCWNVSRNVMLIAEDKAENLVSGHKLILILHALAEKVIDSNYRLPQEVVESFMPFLELEADQSIRWDGQVITDQDWLKMKTSAEKVAGKIFLKLREEGYYQA